MKKKLHELRARRAQKAAARFNDLRAQYGNEVANSTLARLGIRGAQISATLYSLAPVIAAAIVLCMCVAPSVYAQSTTPISSDSGMVWRAGVALIKYGSAILFLLSVGGILLAVAIGITGKGDWQGKLAWSGAGFLASIGGVTALVMDIAHGKDPVADTGALGGH